MRHLACIMDGNRRWAKNQGQIAAYGHEKGVQAIETVIQFCLEHNIPYLSLFAFAQQNFKRSAIEVNFLFSMVIAHVERIIELAHQEQIAVRFIGDTTLFSHNLLAACRTIEDKTKHYDRLTLSFLFCYGGQEEIIAGVRGVADAVAKGMLNLQELTPQTFKRFLWMGDIPDPDLMIRTGYQQRLSNFLLFQSAYTELYFADCLWPELTREHIIKAYDYYISCARNFGV